MADDAETTVADAAHGAADAAHASGPGMPQLDIGTFPNQILWLVLTLLAIYFILTKIAIPRIAAVIAERQGTLTNDLATAEDLKRQAAEAEENYNKALSDARAEAQTIAQETRDGIQAQLQVELDKADAEIAAKTAESTARIGEIQAGAAATAQEVATDVAAEIVRQLAPGQDVDAKAIAAAVAARAGS